MSLVANGSFGANHQDACEGPRRLAPLSSRQTAALIVGKEKFPAPANRDLAFLWVPWAFRDFILRPLQLVFHLNFSLGRHGSGCGRIPRELPLREDTMRLSGSIRLVNCSALLLLLSR